MPETINIDTFQWNRLIKTLESIERSLNGIERELSKTRQGTKY